MQAGGFINSLGSLRDRQDMLINGNLTLPTDKTFNFRIVTDYHYKSPTSRISTKTTGQSADKSDNVRLLMS